MRVTHAQPLVPLRFVRRHIEYLLDPGQEPHPDFLRSLHSSQRSLDHCVAAIGIVCVVLVVASLTIGRAASLAFQNLRGSLRHRGVAAFR